MSPSIATVFSFNAGHWPILFSVRRVSIIFVPNSFFSGLYSSSLSSEIISSLTDDAFITLSIYLTRACCLQPKISTLISG